MLKILMLLILAATSAHAETCHYTGKTDYNGQASIETRYQKTVDAVVFRTLMRFTASFFGIRIEYDYDESDLYSGEKMQSSAVNSRYFVNGQPKRQQWDRYDFSWNQTPTQSHATRISVKDAADLTAQFPKFAKYWDTSTFGSDWFADFSAASPSVRTDLEMPGFTSKLQSMLYVAFVKLRRADPKNGAINFVPFVPGSKTGKPADPINAEPTVNGTSVTWSTPLSLGSVDSPTGSPATFTVDQRSHLLESVHLVIHQDILSAGGNLTLQGCTP